MHRMDSSFRWNDNDCVCVIPVKTGIHYKYKFPRQFPKNQKNLFTKSKAFIYRRLRGFAIDKENLCGIIKTSLFMESKSGLSH